MSTAAIKNDIDKLYYQNFTEYETKLDMEDLSTESRQKRLSYDPIALNPLFDEERRRETFICLQKWEGFVTGIESEHIKARLIDLTNKGFEEDAEIPIDEISEDDFDLLIDGAIFYWSLGYLRKNNGQKVRQSIIKFRRLPAWQKSELDKAKQKAQGLRDLIGEV